MQHIDVKVVRAMKESLAREIISIEMGFSAMVTLMKPRTISLDTLLQEERSPIMHMPLHEHISSKWFLLDFVINIYLRNKLS